VEIITGSYLRGGKIGKQYSIFKEFEVEKDFRKCKKSKVKISILQAMEAHRVARG
jgi:hypothetical protein